MSQRFERAKTSAEIGWLRIRHLVHTLGSAVALSVLVAGAAALLGPWVVAELPVASVVVSPLVDVSEWVPLSPIGEIVAGVVAAAILYRL